MKNLAQAGFLLMGAANTLLGPILPALSARWWLDDAQAGHLFTAQFAGALAASAASGWLIKRLGLTRLLAVGYGLLAVSIACLGFCGATEGVVALFVLGVGLGCVSPATNLLVAELNPARRAAALNLLNFIWGVGAMLFPPLISLSAAGDNLAGPLAGLSLALALIALGFMRQSSFRIAEGVAGFEPADSPTRQLIGPYALLTGLFVFINVGAETAVGGWVATYAKRLDGAAESFWAFAPSLFWGGMLAGRAAAPAVLRRVNEGRLVLVGLFVALSGLSLILLGRGLAPVAAGAALAGLGLAPVFPTTFAIFTQHFGSQASRFSGALFVLSALGAAIIPWVVGITSARHGELRAGLGVLWFGVAAMVVLQFFIVFALARAESSPPR